MGACRPGLTICWTRLPGNVLSGGGAPPRSPRDPRLSHEPDSGRARARAKDPGAAVSPPPPCGRILGAVTGRHAIVAPADSLAVRAPLARLHPRRVTARPWRRPAAPAIAEPPPPAGGTRRLDAAGYPDNGALRSGGPGALPTPVAFAGCRDRDEPGRLTAVSAIQSIGERGDAGKESAKTELAGCSRAAPSTSRS